MRIHSLACTLTQRKNTPKSGATVNSARPALLGDRCGTADRRRGCTKTANRWSRLAQRKPTTVGRYCNRSSLCRFLRQCDRLPPARRLVGQRLSTSAATAGLACGAGRTRTGRQSTLPGYTGAFELFDGETSVHSGARTVKRDAVNGEFTFAISETVSAALFPQGILVSRPRHLRVARRQLLTANGCSRNEHCRVAFARLDHVEVAHPGLGPPGSSGGGTGPTGSTANRPHPRAPLSAARQQQAPLAAPLPGRQVQRAPTAR